MLRLRTLATGLVAGALLLLPVAQPPAAAALPGPTTSCAGVWVVVEISPKDRTVRCATDTRNGFAALKSAGLKVTKVGSNDNTAYLCAIRGYPKNCRDAWDQMRYWSYWKAKLNPDGSWGEWVYAATGPGRSRPAPGYAEGWRFVDGNATAPSITPPRQYTDTAKPTISGTAKVGATLTAGVGTWSPAPSFSYRWYRSGKKIPRATKASYKLTKADRGKRITVKVTGKRSGWETVTTTSKKTAKVKK